MVLFRSRNSVRNEDVIPDISAPILLRMTAIRNSMRAEHQFIGDKHSSLYGVQQGKSIVTCNYIILLCIRFFSHHLNIICQ